MVICIETSRINQNTYSLKRLYVHSKTTKSYNASKHEIKTVQTAFTELTFIWNIYQKSIWQNVVLMAQQSNVVHLSVLKVHLNVNSLSRKQLLELLESSYFAFVTKIGCVLSAGLD